MPELPEVEAIRFKLNRVLKNKKFFKIHLLREKTFPNFERKQGLIVGQKIIAVKRRAKILNFVFENNYSLLVHLKMTGQFIFKDSRGKRLGGGHPTADWINDLPSKHTRVIFDFSDGTKLFFNDMRVFAWVKVFANYDLKKQFANLGPDILTESEIKFLHSSSEDCGVPGFDLDYLLEKAKRRKVSIKQFIMNNQVIAGIGNIYASESLFDAKISPLIPAVELNRKEMGRLLTSMRKIVKKAIVKGGTTFDGKYVGIDGFAGSFQNDLKVYGQMGKACQACGIKIERIKQGGRSSFYCPSCQK